jgi:membrane protein YdbS with pleckstrin-like domain
MVFYGCPKCQEPMSSPDSMAGQSESCPSCGNVAMVPASAAIPSPVAPPVATPVATSAPRAVAGGGQRFVVNPSMFRQNPVGLIMLVIIFGVSLPLGFVDAPLWVIPLVIALLFVAWWLQCYATRMVITTDRVTVVVGILSRRTSEVRVSDIRNIRVLQGIFQRMMRAGGLVISSAATGGEELRIDGIAKPEAVAERVRRYMGSSESAV